MRTKLRPESSESFDEKVDRIEKALVAVISGNAIAGTAALIAAQRRVLGHTLEVREILSERVTVPIVWH